jgi:hypothetical protein
MSFLDVEDISDSRTVLPPLPILGLVVPLIVIGLLGTVLEPPSIWSAVGYVASGLGAVVAIGVFRFIDTRRSALVGYRLVPWATRACQLLLLVAWVVSIFDAWRLATDLARA